MEVPEKIYHLISDEKYLTDEVGMSEASVLMFKDKVLKIQKCSEEAENEYHIPTC